MIQYSSHIIVAIQRDEDKPFTSGETLEFKSIEPSEFKDFMS